jgi:PAS domain S-box-containing protein
MLSTLDPAVVFRDLAVMALLLDGEGRIVTANDAWLERFAYDPREVVGQTPADFATPDSARRIREEHRPRFRRTGRLDNVPVEFVTRRGETVAVLASTRARYGADGLIAYSVNVFQELSDRYRLERQYRDQWQSTPAMLHTIDSQGRLIAVSDYWLAKLGYSRAEVLGRTILDFLGEESRRELADRLPRIVEQPDLQDAPRTVLTRSGERLELLMSTHTERDPHGAFLRRIVASADVTERNRAEAALKDAYAQIATLKEELERERDYLREEVRGAMNEGRIVGESPALAAMLARIDAVAATPAGVLIIGETGTGKELVAHAIHARSNRAAQPLVKVNCASIPRELFESEFFGHVRGAFTGANRDRPGRFQLADGGTIFLDEVGEIPMELQGKLLRVLQERQFERVGDDHTQTVDVRVIAATNKDLERAVEAGEFREDLYYRLSVVPVAVPPLRKRGEDVLRLARHFLDQACREFGRHALEFTPAQLAALRAYDWPGNVRELRNVIERAVILARGDALVLDLPAPGAGRVATAEVVPGPAPGVAPAPAAIRTDADLRAEQRASILAALAAAGWRVSGTGGAAELLGVRPTTLAARMRRLGIRRPAR